MMNRMNSIFCDYKDEFEYTLADLAHINKDFKYANEYSSTSDINSLLDIRNNILNWNTGTELQQILTSEKVVRLWQFHILPKYFDEIVSLSDIELNLKNVSASDANSVFGRFYMLFESILANTYERFSKLIDIYAENETNLLKQLETISSTKARNNEIPQTSDVDPYDTKFANNSSVGEVITKADPASITSRLAEIRNMWFSLNEEWANMFDDLFITKGA